MHYDIKYENSLKNSVFIKTAKIAKKEIQIQIKTLILKTVDMRSKNYD